MKFHVLLADVNLDHRLTLEKTLSKVGVEVVTTGNGNEAIALAKQSRVEGVPFDVVLMDLELAGMNGLDAARTLRFSGYDRPIIAISDAPNASDRQKSIDCGCDDLISKMLDSKKLLMMVHNFSLSLAH